MRATAGMLMVLLVAGCEGSSEITLSGIIITARTHVNDATESGIYSEWSVVDERWQAVPGAKVSVLRPDPARTLIASAEAGPDGRYAIRLPPQEAVLRVETDGYKTAESKITIGVRGHYTRNTVILVPTGTKP